MRRRLPPTDADTAAVLRHYDVGPPLTCTASGGTANVNALVTTGQGTFFLRRRNPKYTGPDVLDFDHRLQKHLARRGMCTPLALTTRDGGSWVRLDESVYELYPYTEGHGHDRESLAQIVDAARQLARFHVATADFDGRAQKQWPRYDSPALIVEGLREAWARAASSGERGRIGWLFEQVDRLAACLPDALYQSLPACVIHGDYHPGNLKFRGDAVVGVFDLDWATRQPRARDLADGLWFSAARRRTDIDDRDIASLTQAPELDTDRSIAFLRAYLEFGRIEEAELQALPDFMRARWLYCRVAGMSKVPEEQRVAFLLHEVEGPLRVLDEGGDELVRGLSALLG